MLFCYSVKCGEWPYLFATIVANGKILLDIAALKLRIKQCFPFCFCSQHPYSVILATVTAFNRYNDQL